MSDTAATLQLTTDRSTKMFIQKHLTKTDTEKGVDNYHYLSRDFNSGTTGAAPQVVVQGWQYQGSVCWRDQKYRTAISEVMGPEGTDWMDLKTDAAEVTCYNIKKLL